MNGDIIKTGESYPDKAACKKGIASIKKNAPIAEIANNTDEKAAVKKTAGAKAKTTAKKTTGNEDNKQPAPKPRGRKPKKNGE